MRFIEKLLQLCSKYLPSATYFLIGYNRQENNRRHFIYFDGTSFQEFPLESSVNMIAPTATVDVEKGVVTVAPLAGCRQFTLDGKTTKTISPSTPHAKEAVVPIDITPVRQPHHPRRKTGRRRDPCFSRRSHYGLRDIHRKHAKRSSIRKTGAKMPLFFLWNNRENTVVF